MSSPSGLRVAAGGLAAMPLATVLALAQPGPLAPVNIVVDAVRHEVRFEVLNAATERATAWVVEVSRQEVVGERPIGRVYHDYYQATGIEDLRSAPAGMGPLASGESRPASMSLPPDVSVASVTVRVRAGILEDGSAFGDEADVAALFDARARARDAFSRYLGMLRELRAVGPEWRPAFERQLEADMVRATEPDRRALQRVMEVLEGVMALERSGRTSEALDAVLDIMERQHRAAERHARRARR